MRQSKPITFICGILPIIHKKRTFYQTVVCTLLFGIALILSKYFVQISLIQGDSMFPTYYNNEIVLIKKNIHTYKRNSVVVFYNQSMHKYLVKRIIGIPGDTVE